MPQYEISKEQLLQLIQRDCEMVLGFYLGDQLNLEVPEFHIEIWDEFLELLDRVNHPEHLVGILNKLLGVPREHAKTTLTKLAVVLFFRYSRIGFCAYVSNTFTVAMNAIRDIKDWLVHPQAQELYGPSGMVKSSETDGVYIYDISVPGRIGYKRVILKAFGVNTQIRGTVILNRRPDLLIFDDVESRETADSPTQQAKLDAWCLGTAMKSMAAYGVCIFIGNMISETTLLARLAKEKDWSPVVFGSIIKNHKGEYCPLWPGRWTLDALLEDYAKYRRLGNGHVWEAEMMNLTAKEIFSDSLENAIRPPMPMPEDIEAGFICLDPAFGENAWNDDSAVSVHVRLRGADIPIVVETVNGRFIEERMFDEMLAASLRWGITTWCIESVAAQRLLLQLFRMYFMQRKMSPEFFLLLPITGGREAKSSRILAFRTSVSTGSYAISENCVDLFERLKQYTPLSKDKDDLCDTAALGLVSWATHSTVIISQGVHNVSGALMGTGEFGGSTGSIEMGIP